MPRTYLTCGLLACTFLFCPNANPQGDTPAQVTVKPVSYKELGKLVRAQRGKVVVVDFWGLT